MNGVLSSLRRFFYYALNAMSPDPLERLAQLAAKVDAFFSRVEARHGPQMECRSGCHDCCLPGLSVTKVEARALRDALLLLSEEQRAKLKARVALPRDRCVLLDEQGRCSVYHARPMICRSHGVPIRIRDQRGLPLIDACFRNFRERGAESMPSEDVLDQESLSKILLAIDALDAQETGRIPGERISLDELVLGLPSESER